MESRIVSLFKVGFNITNSWNSKPQKKVFLFVLQDMKIFTPRKKKKKSYISIPKIRIYLFEQFYFFVLFPHNSQVLLP